MLHIPKPNCCNHQVITSNASSSLVYPAGLRPSASAFFLRTALLDSAAQWVCSQGAIPWAKTRLSWWIRLRLPFGNFVLSSYKKSHNWWLKSFLRVKHHLGEKHFKGKHTSTSVKEPVLLPAHKVISGFLRGGPARTHCPFALLPAHLCQSSLPCPADAGALSRPFLPAWSWLTRQTLNLDK